MTDDVNLIFLYQVSERSNEPPNGRTPVRPYGVQVTSFNCSAAVMQSQSIVKFGTQDGGSNADARTRYGTGERSHR
jgi:hypothetical protein